MKNVLFAILSAFIIISCGVNKEPGYTITGTITGIDTGYVYLEKTDVHPWVAIDSARIGNGKFIMKGRTDMPEMYALMVRDKQIYVPVFIENVPIDVTIYSDSTDKSVIKGSAAQDLYNKYLEQSAGLDRKLEDVYNRWKAAKEANDEAAMKVQDSISGALEKEVKRLVIDFAKANGKSVVAPYLVIRNSWQFELPDLQEASAAFDTALNRSTYVKAINERIEILKKVAIGQPAVQFSMNDSLGNPVALSSFAGKVLLVDFWASWCKPCRAENPNVVKAYGMFHNKGFEILGVSFDMNRDKWIRAVKDDHLTWTQVSDLKGWGNEAGHQYGINSIPSNVLLDKDQVIIAKNLRGDELLKKLTELLGPAVAVKGSIRK